MIKISNCIYDIDRMLPFTLQNATKNEKYSSSGEMQVAVCIEVKIEDLWTKPTLCYKQLKLGRGGAAVRCNSAKNLLESGS